MSAPRLEEMVEMGLPTGEKKQRLVLCSACGEFYFPFERDCPICGLNRALAQLVNLASPELLDAEDESDSR